MGVVVDAACDDSFVTPFAFGGNGETCRGGGAPLFGKVRRRRRLPPMRLGTVVMDAMVMEVPMMIFGAQ